MGRSSLAVNMVRISIILCLIFAVCFVSGNQESREAGFSSESLLDRDVREARKRRVKGGSSKKRRGGPGRKLKKAGKKTKRNKNMKQVKKSEKVKYAACARQSGPDDSTCMANIGTAMDYVGNQVGNFERQKKRIESFNTLMGKKGAKKDAFVNTTSFLETALGTDKNCSKAGSSEVADSAKDTFSTLSACSSSISGGCAVPNGTFNQTNLDECLTKVTEVSTKTATCYNLLSSDVSAACTCYAEAVTLVDEVKAAQCSAKASFDSIKAAKDNCLGNFSTCKKAEDSSVGLIHSCNGNTTPAPITAAPTTAASATTAAPAPATTAAPAPATTAAPAPATTGSSACKCGIERTSRIVGGAEVTPVDKYPWMVSLVGSSGNHFCGGTLVASKYVVSAAHCMFTDQQLTVARPLSELKVNLGQHQLSVTTEGGLEEKTIDVTKYTNHEDFTMPNNDIVVLELAEEVDLATYTPACLAKSSDTTTFDGKTALVYGWGALSYGTGDYPDVLMELSVPVVSKETCQTALAGFATITDGMICAGGVAGQDRCQGDSGGPLTYKAGDQHVLIGDVSFGDQCALAGRYGVYGRISHYRTWIESKMTSPKYCGDGPDAAA